MSIHLPGRERRQRRQIERQIRRRKVGRTSGSRSKILFMFLILVFGFYIYNSDSSRDDGSINVISSKETEMQKMEETIFSQSKNSQEQFVNSASKAVVLSSSQKEPRKEYEEEGKYEEEGEGGKNFVIEDKKIAPQKNTPLISASARTVTNNPQLKIDALLDKNEGGSLLENIEREYRDELRNN